MAVILGQCQSNDFIEEFRYLETCLVQDIKFFPNPLGSLIYPNDPIRPVKLLKKTSSEFELKRGGIVLKVLTSSVDNRRREILERFIQVVLWKISQLVVSYRV